MKRINLFLLLLFLLAGESYAQYCHAIVRISHSPVDIINIARLISSQTGLEYSLNMQNASLKKQITLRVGTCQLSDILKQVQQQAGLNYKIIGDHILFMEDQTGENKNVVTVDILPKKNIMGSLVVVMNRRGYSQVVSRAAPRTVGTAENQIRKKRITTKDQKNLTIKTHSTDPVSPSPEQPTYTKATDISLLPLSKKMSFRKSDIIQSNGHPIQIKDISYTNKESSHTIFVKAGLSTDETLFMNVSLLAGIKYVYGIFSYGTTFNGNRLRFGLGIPVKLNEEQQLSFNATTGLRVKSSFVDSVPVTPAVKENLYRYGIAWSKTYKQRWTLQVQVHYNMLYKTSDSTNIGLGYNHFYYATPSYVLSRSSGSHSEKRAWIGAQIALYYKLF